MSTNNNYETLDLHVGKALKMITDNYPTLTKVILELIQNSLDSDATNIVIAINYVSRNLSVSDNGSGITPAKFAKAIKSVCNSIKQKDKMGEFGIGMLSPLGKCKTFSITSAPKGVNTRYMVWTFDCQSIISSRSFPNIPFAEAPEYLYSQSGCKSPGRTPVPWRTRVKLESFTRDSSISEISVDDLRSLILAHFSESMRRLGTSITIKLSDGKQNRSDLTFQASKFCGEPMGTVVYGEKNTGETSFEMYVSPRTKKGRQGQVLIGIKGNDFRVPFQTFAKSIRDIVGRETIDVLGSGTFEGAILSNRCILHPNRKEFEANDALMEFCLHLESWVLNHGQKHIAKMQDTERDLYLQAVGTIALNNVEEKIKNQLPHLMDIIEGLKKGHIGNGHHEFSETKPEQEFKSGKAKKKDEDWKETLAGLQGGKENQRPPERTEPDKDHPKHHPFKVMGPTGTNRKVVRGHSTGLQYVFEELPGNDNHWLFDPITGILTFNIRSSVWESMERSGERNLIHYQVYITLKALELQRVPATLRPSVYEFLQKELPTAGVFIASTVTLPPRKAKSEVGKVIKGKK